VVAILLCMVFLFCISMGGSGVAVSFAPVWLSKSVPRPWIPILFGLCVILGSSLSGARPVQVLSRGLLTVASLDLRWTEVIIGTCTIALLLAALFRIPQSTSHPTVSAIVGVGAHLHWIATPALLRILAAWVLLPLGSFLISLILGRLAPKRLEAFLTVQTLDTIRDHPILRLLTVLGCCYVAYAIGSNNVANAAGPLVGSEVFNPRVASLVTSPVFGLGAALLGFRLLKVVGSRLAEVGPLGSAYVAFATGTFLLTASYLGIPQSVVQLNVAAIVGIGAAKNGVRTMMGRSLVRQGLLVWAMTPVLSFLVAWGLASLIDLRG